MSYEGLQQAIEEITSQDRHAMYEPWFDAGDIKSGFIRFDGLLKLDDFRKIADAIDDLKKRGRL